jgi:hypothetical protein
MRAVLAMPVTRVRLRADFTSYRPRQAESPRAAEVAQFVFVLAVAALTFAILAL